MKILVPGATGTVGRSVVEQALSRGHDVIAVARTPEKLEISHERLTKAAVDILDVDALTPWLEGVDVVVSTVGVGTANTPTQLYSAGTKNLLAAMGHHGVERLVVISSEVAEHWAHQGLLKLWIVLPLLQHFLGATYDDMRRMDIVLWESDARWTAIRAPRIQPVQPGKAKNRYRLSASAPVPRGWMITAPDMATALLDIAERNDLNRRHVYVAN